MKINRLGREKATVEEISPGQTFEFNETLYVRVSTGIHALDPGCFWGCRLADGVLTKLGPGTQVFRVNGEFQEVL